MATALLALSGVARELQHEGVAGSKPFTDGCSLPAMDGAERFSGMVCECPHEGAPC